MGWIKYTISGRSTKPRITIRKGGQIGLNDTTVKQYKLDNYKFVVLFIDEEELKIGIKPTIDAKEEGIRKFSVGKYGASIPAKGFIQTYKLDEIKKRQLDCSWDEKNKMLVANYER